MNVVKDEFDVELGNRRRIDCQLHVGPLLPVSAPVSGDVSIERRPDALGKRSRQ
jgi:hypothetical protein